MEFSAYEQKKLALVKEITDAFDGVSRENGVSLSESWVIDDYGSMEERAEARKLDTETRWQDVPENQISYGDSCLSFLDEIGFHYYLPAYLVWYLRHMDNDDPECHSYGSNTFDSILHHLHLDNNATLREIRLSRFQLFNREQSKAVAHFLQMVDESLEKWELDSDEADLKEMISEGCSEDEIQAEKQQNESRRLERASKETKSQHALKKYWRQFL